MDASALQRFVRPAVSGVLRGQVDENTYRVLSDAERAREVRAAPRRRRCTRQRDHSAAGRAFVAVARGVTRPLVARGTTGGRGDGCRGEDYPPTWAGFIEHAEGAH